QTCALPIYARDILGPGRADLVEDALRLPREVDGDVHGLRGEPTEPARPAEEQGVDLERAGIRPPTEQLRDLARPLRRLEAGFDVLHRPRHDRAAEEETVIGQVLDQRLNRSDARQDGGADLPHQEVLERLP